jgi:GNAT superfamily N-acetyltransferase
MPSTNPSLPEGYTLHSGFPITREYLHLRAATGLTPKSAAQAKPIPQGSWYGCYIQWTDPTTTGSTTAVAMGRIIGDGGWYFHIADMAVLPDHQRKGLGDVVLKELLAHIRAHAPCGEGDEPYVNLLADGPGRKLYAKNGFVDAAPAQMGMALPKGWWKEI